MPSWLWVGLLASSLANAPTLARGRALYDDVQFQAAADVLSVVAQQPSSTPAERDAALDLWARSLLALGRTPDAESVYGTLLTRNPDAQLLPGASPKIQKLFRGVKERLEATRAPAPAPPVSAPQPAPVTPTVVVQRPAPPVRARAPAWLAWTGVGTGAAVAAAGGVLALVAENDYHRAFEATSAEQTQKLDAQYRSLKPVSNGLLIGGGALAATSFVLHWAF